MCGIAGYVGPVAASEAATTVLKAMTDAISYRGPDDYGAWVDAALGVGLAHRRLSIVDLSPAGHQPMVSASGRFVIVYNGEIYNHSALGKELLESDAALTFVGHSDTEIMLAAFERWGVIGALQRFNGMFAFALFDRQERRLHLSRDRIGEKPLYYTTMNGSFVFGSELKALKRHPVWRSEIDPEGLLALLRYGYVRGDKSIYLDVFKVQPGTCVTLNLEDDRLSISSEQYWSAAEVIDAGLARPLAVGDDEALAQLEDLLTDAVKLRMVADVPLGAFLSGGIDSSTVVALMQRVSSRPVRTFSIGFGEKRFNEADSARAVARFLGTDHTELYVTPRDCLDVIPKLPSMYDEPFADSSQIPTYLVSRLARQHVTVSLSGDGGDELFCGYERYGIVDNLSRGLERMPRVLRMAAAAGIRAVPMAAWDILGSPLPERISAGRTGDRVYKLAELFRLDRFSEIFDSVLKLWQAPEEILAHPPLAHGFGNEHEVLHTTGSRYEQMMAFDLRTYLPGDILVKMDRASMAVSLEARIPLLDHRIVEYAWRLPMTFKRRNGVSKWLLRRLLHTLIPRELVERPKQGFGVPIELWLRGELREWTLDLLAPETIKRDGFFNASAISRYLEEHISGRRSWAAQLWAVLMFQAWLHAS